MKTTADVVIIGAGIQGLSVAYHLAACGVSNIAVVEKEFVGAGSSGRSASMLMLQRENASKIALSLFSYDHYMRFEDEVGADPRFERIGFLSVVPAEKVEESLERAHLRKRMGVATDILRPEDIGRLAPLVDIGDIVLGVHGPDDGVIDAVAIMQGYAAAAKRRGASILQGVRATGLEHSGGHVTAVLTTEGPIATPTVVNAAGADAAEVGAWAGLTIPIMNRTRSIFVTDAFPAIPKGAPMVEDAAAEWYYRKEGDAVLMGMGKEPAGKVARTPNWDYLPTVAAFAAHRVPALSNARIASGWSGIRPLTSDLNPILGPVESLRGYLNCCGWGGEGVMHAPAGGRILAETILGTNPATFDPAPFLLSRFNGAVGASRTATVEWSQVEPTKPSSDTER